MRFAFLIGVVGLVTALFVPAGGNARRFRPMRFVPLLSTLRVRRRIG